MVTTHNTTACLEPGKGKRRHQRWAFLAGAAIAVLWMWAERGHTLTGEPGVARSEKGHSVEDYVRLQRPEFMKGTQARHGIVFVIDPADFGCPPCYEDFERLLETLIVLTEPEASKRILLLIRQGVGDAWRDSTTVRRWADIQGFSVPLQVVSDATYRSFGVGKTRAIVVNSSIQSVLAKEIPMEHKAHAEIWTRLEERGRVQDP